MSPFNSPFTAPAAPAQTPWAVFQGCSLPAEHSPCISHHVPASGAWPQAAEQGRLDTTTVIRPLSSGRAGFHLCAAQSKIKTTHHTLRTIVDLTEQCQEKTIHLASLVFPNSPIKASRGSLKNFFFPQTDRMKSVDFMQMSKEKGSAQASCHCLRKAPPHPVRQDIRDGFLQLSPLLHRLFLSAFWCYHCIILWQTWFSSGRFLDCLSCNTWPIFPLLQLVIMWAPHEWVPFYEVLRNYKLKAQ